VDDDPDLLRMVRQLLEEEGLTVETAADGEQALERAGYRRPALVVLDLLLPDLRGEQVAQTLRNHYGSLPIVLISASGRTQEAAHRLGVFAYFDKPFETDALVAAVRLGARLPRPPGRSAEAEAVALAADKVIAALQKAGVNASLLKLLADLEQQTRGGE
jgi:DNA-binding response OmpR family regulator